MCIVLEIHEGVDKLVVLEIVYIPFLGEALDDVQASHDLHLFLLWLHILHFNSGLNLLELRSKTVEHSFVVTVDGHVFPTATDRRLHRKPEFWLRGFWVNYLLSEAPPIEFIGVCFLHVDSEGSRGEFGEVLE